MKMLPARPAINALNMSLNVIWAVLSANKKQNV